jgi:hypothetical protein
MTTRTCEACGGEIRPSYIGPAPILGAQASKGDMTYPAACQGCGKTYADILSISLTLADLEMVQDRLSPSTRQELTATAAELSPGCFDVALAEDRARDLASKAANLGLVAIADKVRHELNGLAKQRRQR